MSVEIFESKISMIGFADLLALKTLTEKEYYNLAVNADPQDEQGFINEGKSYISIIEKVISHKIFDLQGLNQTI